MQSKMNTLLSDLVVEYHKLQSFHWYIKGSDFFQVHAKLEELYDGIRDIVDDVAEAMLMEGMQPVSTMNAFLANAHIEESAGTYVSSSEVFDAVEKDFGYLLEAVKGIKRTAEEQQSDLIAAKADSYIEHFAQNIWMIKQSRM